MAVSRYITREEFESKHGENIRRLDLLADSVVEIRKDLVEVKAILKSVGFNGSSKLVREFLEFAPELVREGRELRKERELWEAHDLIRRDRVERLGKVGAYLALPKRVMVGLIIVLGGLASLAIFAGWATQTFHGVHIPGI